MRSSGFTFSLIHWPLVGVVFLIGMLGIYNLYSAAAARDPHLYLTQLALFGGTAVLAAVVVVLDYRVLEGLAYPVYAVSCLLLLGVLVQGKTAGGAQRWLQLGPLTFQPSELAKLAVVLCLARYFSHRLVPQGYSIRRLFRPLNPSRPLAVGAVLVLAWSNPWLTDPVGSVARLIHDRLDGPAPPIGDLWWFRVFLLVLIALLCVGGIVFVIRLDRQRALLDPWPAGRRNKIIMAWGVMVLLLAGGVLVAWKAPFVRDPFGWAIDYFNRAASEGGPYFAMVPGIGFRLFLVISTAGYLAASVLSLRLRSTRLEDIIVAPIDLVAAPAVLILIEPDLGTAGIVVLIGLTIIFVVGVRKWSLVILGAMGACISVVAWFGVLKDYQKRRILTFIDPEQDLQGAGWNAVQSMIAVGSGRWTGKGHMEGTQTQLSFLPEQHTDFAFSVWAEEQGFLGCLVVLVLFLLLLVFALAIAQAARDLFGSLLAVGVTAMILWQTLINVGMVIGVLPVVGMTLPLFSYGGSSLAAVMLGVGLLLNLHLRRRAH